MIALFPGRAPDLVVQRVTRPLLDALRAGHIALIETPRGWYVWMVQREAVAR